MGVQYGDPQDVVRTGAGERRFELRHSWFYKSLTPAIFMLFGVVGIGNLIVTGGSVVPLIVWTVFGLCLYLVQQPLLHWLTYAILHSTWVDVRDGSSREGKSHIPFASISQMTTNEKDISLWIAYKKTSRIWRAIAGDDDEITIRLRDEGDLSRLASAIELGIERARHER